MSQHTQAETSEQTLQKLEESVAKIKKAYDAHHPEKRASSAHTEDEVMLRLEILSRIYGTPREKGAYGAFLPASGPSALH